MSGHGGDELRGGQKRALLAVQELREHPGGELAVQDFLLLLAQLVEDVRAIERLQLLRIGRLGDIHREVPGEGVLRDPLAVLGLLVEVAQVLARLLITPVVGQIESTIEVLDGHPAHCRSLGFLAHWAPPSESETDFNFRHRHQIVKQQK